MTDIGKKLSAQRERHEFSERLISSLKKSNIPVRVVEIHKLFLKNNKNISISTHAIRKWLLGESIPTQEKLRVLSDILLVEPNWLRYGEETANLKINKFNKLNSNQLKLLTEFEKLSFNQKKYILEIIQALLVKGNEV